MIIMSFITEFKTFAMRGNVAGMTAGIIIGGAFGKETKTPEVMITSGVPQKHVHYFFLAFLLKTVVC